MKHLGGVGLGGGTICGLSSIMLNTGDIHEIVPLSRKGDAAERHQGDVAFPDLQKPRIHGDDDRSSIAVPKIRRVRTIAAESIPAAPNSLTNTPAEPHSAPAIAGRARYALLNGSPIQRVPFPSRSGGSRGYIHCTSRVLLRIPAGIHNRNAACFR